jgi:hypothetical protein
MKRMTKNLRVEKDQRQHNHNITLYYDILTGSIHGDLTQKMWFLAQITNYQCSETPKRTFSIYLSSIGTKPAKCYNKE